ncbi:MAG: histidine kinase, partial [Acidimicrobiia bacterium]
VWMLGVLMATRRDHVVELEAKTAALEAAERQLAHRAVAEERSRIARELHDVVAHAMSVITVQAGVGWRLQPGQVVAAAEDDAERLPAGSQRRRRLRGGGDTVGARVPHR